MAYIGKITTNDDFKKYTPNVLKELEKSILKLEIKKANTLLFWLNNWNEKYLLNENSFDYHSLKFYQRGNIVEADFGFNVGSEEGGLHYALIIENNNSKSNKTIMVVPLGSLKDNQKPEEIDEKHEIFLGTAIFQDDIKRLEAKIIKQEIQIEKLEKETQDTSRLMQAIIKNKKELKKLCKGSVALVNQMCALSKMRIIKPKYKNELLSTFKLNPELLDKIDQKIIELYLNPKLTPKKNNLKLHYE